MLAIIRVRQKRKMGRRGEIWGYFVDLIGAGRWCVVGLGGAMDKYAVLGSLIVEDRPDFSFGTAAMRSGTHTQGTVCFIG
jgi:hypothetical protein